MTPLICYRNSFLRSIFCVPVVEHYKKTQSVYSEDPLRANELKVTGAGKVHDLSTRASYIIKVGMANLIILRLCGIL